MTASSRLFNTLVVCVLFFAVFSFAFADTTSTLRPVLDGGNDDAKWRTTAGGKCDVDDCYIEVDESSGASCTNSDGDTSYIWSASEGFSQTFNLDTSPITDDSTITNIAITACYIEGDALGSFQTRYCHNGTCSDSGIDLVGGAAYDESTQDHSVSFTKTSGSDIEIGVTQTNNIKIIRISQISAIITYVLPGGDATAPAAVTDLATSGAAANSIDLSWTAPGDDGSTGTAATYDVRYSTSVITDLNWFSATQTTGEPSPSVAGSSESMTVSGLFSDTLYYFAIKTSDEAPNESALSNVPSLSTTVSADITPPDAVSNLALSNPSNSSIVVSWTASGDDGSTGTATEYDLRYSTSNITAGNFSAASQVTGEPTPSVAGSSESKTVTGLSANTLYYFAIKTSDEVPNISVISNVPSLSTTNVADSTAPDAVSNLALSGATDTSIDVGWTAPGDDGSSGTASSYDVRYSTSVINDGNWSSATQATGESTPSVAGSSESMTVSGLSSGTLYYIALKTSDEVPNESTLSNVPSLSTTGGGGSVSIPGGAGAVAPSTISFSGRAYPGSSIEVLTRSALDELINVPLELSSVDENGAFVAQTLGLLGGDYFVGLQVTDKDGNKTDFISFNINLLEGNLILGDIVIPPTMYIETQGVKIGEDVHISGYGIPQTTLELDIDDEITQVYKLESDGSYDIVYNVTGLSVDTHYVRVRVVDSVNDAYSAFSSPRAFKITSLSFPEADFNKDDKVNITDWSIFLSKWGSEGDKSSIDFNKDGMVNVSDLSIFLRAINI
ncbi:fibronectin type III domain-containing protein [candidate division KSB1 bacterium]